tara:strand:- start:23856 stop:24323 length:468 start_codon:yes stop_codon:yes gene_type:complete
MGRAGNYDIKAEQGSDFNLYLEYQENNGTGITLNSYTASMQVRRSVVDTDALLWVSGTTVVGTTHLNRAVTGGGSTGEFDPTLATGGVLGTGGIRLDATSAGKSGSTGGILITIGTDTMKNVPAGRHFYDLELHSGKSAEKVLKGRFEVEGEVTR